MTGPTSGPRPRRSVLFVPGVNERAIEKARTLNCDGVIFDLEDSVAPERKAEARDRVVGVVREGGYSKREVIVRVNGRGTAWIADDIAAVAAIGADAILLPKVDDAETVHQAAAMLDAAGAPPALRLWCMIETPAGVLNAAAIAGAHQRMALLMFGAADLSKDLRAPLTPDRHALATSIALTVLAARAHGLDVLDSPFFDIQDLDGFAAACRDGRTFGFDGKALIHPRTIDIANQVFAPSDEEVAQARRIVAAHEDAVAKGLGVGVLDGQLIEGLHAEAARRLIALADAIAE